MERIKKPMTDFNEVANPSPASLQDGEMTRFNQGTGEFEGTGDINTDTGVNFGSKNIATEGIVEAGTGTFKLGDAIAESSAGENKTTTNLVSGQHFNPIWIEQTENISKARLTISGEQELIQEASKADIIINPSWQSDPVVDWRVVKMTFEVDTTITNVVINITKGGSAFYSARLGTLTANVEKTIDLKSTENNVPAEAFTGDAYILTLTSVDGDVRSKGSIANSLPFFKVGYFEFHDVASQTLPESTGVVRGGEISSSNPANFNVASGFGYIVDCTTPNSNTVKRVEWEGVNSIPHGIVGTEILIIYVDTNSTIQTINLIASDGIFQRDNIVIGALRIEGGSLVTNITRKYDSNEPYMQFVDLLDCLGTTRCSGLSSGPATGLQFTVSAGAIFAVGAGTEVGSRVQNKLDVSAASPAVFDRVLGIQDTEPASSVNTLDPGFYDDGGPIPAVIGGSANQATIQYIYKAPIDQLGLRVMYGQTIYSTIDEALLNADTEQVTAPEIVVSTNLLLGRIVCRAGGADITDTDDFVFLGGAKFGSSLIGGGSGGGGGGGDFFGAASSQTDEVVTYANTTGVTASNASNVKILDGVISHVSQTSDVVLEEGTTGGVVVRRNNAGVQLSLDTTGSGTDGRLVFQRDGVDYGTFAYLEAFDSFFIRNETDFRGLYVNTTQKKGTLYGTQVPTDDIALDFNSTNTVVKFPSISTATLAGLTYPNGCVYYESTENGLKASVNGSEVFLGSVVDRVELVSTPTVTLNFKYPLTIHTLEITQSTLLNFSNVMNGCSIQLELTGDFPLTFSTEFKELSGGLPYDGTLTNIIYFSVSDANSGIEKIDYIISRRL